MQLFGVYYIIILKTPKAIAAAGSIEEVDSI